MARKSYPLQWPEGWKRTVNRNGRGTQSWQAHFDTSFTRDRDAVLRQLGKRGSHVVITSNLPTRQDGLPYYASVGDPGIAVYWVERGHERVIACDRWMTADLNLRAIDMSLVALRGLDRWGASEMVERAFAGFAALPAGSGVEINVAPPRRTWRDVFAINGLERSMGTTELLAVVKIRHRDLIKKHHPDVGGDASIAAELNAALAEAEKDLRT